jgi:hypothetical protein
MIVMGGIVSSRDGRAELGGRMRSKRFTIASITIDGDDLRIKYGDVLVAAQDGAAHLDWECVVQPFDPAPIEQGAYRLGIVTLEGRRLAGDAVLVRSVKGTHVLRGAGPVDGLAYDELDD